jgi:chromosome segregation ATPase
MGKLSVKGETSKWRTGTEKEFIMTPIEQAENTIRSFEDKRKALLQRQIELADDRQRISFQAHSGDETARARLDKLNTEHASFASELESIEAAIVEARKRLEAARAAEASTANLEEAKQIAALNAKLKEELENADDAFSDAISSVLNARDLLTEMHSLGVASPIDQLFKINAVAAIKTVIQKLPGPYINDFEFMRLSPSQKKEFKALATTWCDQIARQTEQRLPKKIEAA